MYMTEVVNCTHFGGAGTLIRWGILVAGLRYLQWNGFGVYSLRVTIDIIASSLVGVKRARMVTSHYLVMPGTG